jgi:hypothetical protein
MSASSNFFNNLCTQYEKSEDLFKYLQSPEGGSLKVISNKEFPHLAIIRYVKGTTDAPATNMSHANTPYFRSVVWDINTNKPVAITPFKTEPLESFDLFSYKQQTTSCVVEDFWDGTMITLFYDTTVNNWLLATRSNVGASCRFYGPETFNTLFWDTFRFMGLTIQQFDPKLTYTWILQHPSNRIVVPVTAAALRLIQIMNGADEVAAPPHLMNFLSRRLPLAGTAITQKSLDDLVNANNNIFCQGFVIKDTVSGKRWRQRTPVYLSVHEMRGNTPRLDYKWLTLRASGDLNSYLHHYPEDKPAFNALWTRLKDETRDLYTTYCQVFKARSLPSKDAPKHMRKLLYDMQDHYLNHLRPAQLTMTWAACVQWVNSQDVPRQLFLANYKFLQQNKQTSFPYEPTDENLMAPATPAVAEAKPVVLEQIDVPPAPAPAAPADTTV